MGFILWKTAWSNIVEWMRCLIYAKVFCLFYADTRFITCNAVSLGLNAHTMKAYLMLDIYRDTEQKQKKLCLNHLLWSNGQRKKSNFYTRKVITSVYWLVIQIYLLLSYSPVFDITRDCPHVTARVLTRTRLQQRPCIDKLAYYFIEMP